MGIVTSTVGDMPRTSIKVADIHAATMSRPLTGAVPGAGLLAVQIVTDVTGSTAQNHNRIQLLETDFVSRLREDPELAARVQLCLTKMSGGVRTTGYAPLDRYEPLDVVPGGNSPHADLLTRARQNDEQHADACRKAGNEVAVRITLFQADGYSSDDYAAALAAYREYQTRNRVDVFPVIFPPVDGKFINALSIGHEPTDSSPAALSALFGNLLTLLRAAKHDPGVVGRTRSLKTSDMPKAHPGS